MDLLQALDQLRHADKAVVVGKPAFVAHPAFAAAAEVRQALRGTGADINVMAVIDKSPVPLDTWVKMTGEA